MGAIIAENYNITKEKTDFSAARLQNSAYAELNSAFKYILIPVCIEAMHMTELKDVITSFIQQPAV